MQPEFVVCDEPISALDVSIQAQVVRLLGELKASLGLTMLFIAHDLSMVRYISDRMAVMYLGSLVEIGTADDVFFRPKHPYTQISDQLQPRAGPKDRTASAIGSDRRRDLFARKHRPGLPFRRPLPEGHGLLQNHYARTPPTPGCRRRAALWPAICTTPGLKGEFEGQRQSTLHGAQTDVMILKK